jgi:hypothetical protein
VGAALDHPVLEVRIEEAFRSQGEIHQLAVAIRVLAQPLDETSTGFRVEKPTAGIAAPHDSDRLGHGASIGSLPSFVKDIAKRCRLGSHSLKVGNADEEPAAGPPVRRQDRDLRRRSIRRE